MTDAHCHVNSGFEDAGVTYIVNGTESDSSHQATELANRYKNVWACVGVHPEEANRYRLSDIKMLERLAHNPKVIGIGEAGLDYRQGITQTEKEKQKDLFEEMVKLAVETELPIVVHNRNADEDIFTQLMAQISKLKGVLMHCFTRNPEFMKKTAELGAYFSFGGFVVNKKNTRIRRVAAAVPIDKLLLETDAPYSAVNVKIVKEEVARLRNLTANQLEMITDANARVLFKRLL